MRAAHVALFVATTFGCGGAVFTVATGGGADDGGLTSSDASTPSDGTAPVRDSGGGGGDGSREDGNVPDAASLDDSAAATDTGIADSSEADAFDGSLLDAADSAPAMGSDAGVDAAPPPFTTCAAATGPAVVFCSDFDEQTAPPWNWEVSLANNSNGTNAADTTNYLSPSEGYSASVALLILGDEATFASLEEQLTLPAGTSRITYDFAALVRQIDTVDSADAFPIARLVVGQGTGALFVSLVLSKSGLSLQQQYTASDGGVTTETTPAGAGALSTTAWTHVELILNRGATAGETVTVIVDGMAVVNALPAIASPTSLALEIDLGILDVVPTTGGTNTITFDNAIVRAN